MGQERRMILSLVACGRITAGEAERLLAAASDGREWLWAVAAIAILGASQAIAHGSLPGVGHLVDALAAGWGEALHTAIEIGKGMGGLR